MKASKRLIEFENRIEAYFAHCEAQRSYPDEAGLILHLGIDREEYDRYRDNEGGKYAMYARAVEAARLKRESILVRGIYSTDTKSTTGKIFLARQPNNGGLTDKTGGEQKKLTVEVLLDGEAFD